MRNAKSKVLGLLLFWIVCAALMFYIADTSETWAGWLLGKRLPEPEPLKLVTAPLCFQSNQPGRSLSDSALVELARRYRMISDAKTGFTARQMARLREIRPNIQIGRYLNFAAVYNQLHINIIQREHRDWMMRDENGYPVESRLGGGGMMMRPNSEGWRNFLTEKAALFIRKGYDGIMADEVVMCGRLKRDFSGINTETDRPYTTEEYRSHQVGLVRAVKVAIAENSLVLNNVRRGIFYFDQKPYAFLGAADGVVAEGFRGYSHWSLDHHLSDAEWLANVEMMLDIQSRDKAIVAIVQIDKKVADRYTRQELETYERFQYCTFLLGMRDSAYYTAHVTDPDPHKKSLLFYRHHEIDLGEPLPGGFWKTATGYRRGFERASVIVDLNTHEGMIIRKVRIEDEEKRKGD